jgi:hypothetical protein
MVRMRRVPAILLLVLFSFSPIAPVLFVDSESNLPACCRRGGKHHCNMMGGMTDMAEAPPSAPATDALRAKCPFFPCARAVTPNAEAELLAPSQSAGVSVVGQIATAAQANAGYRTSFSHSHQKRGPPSLLS